MAHRIVRKGSLWAAEAGGGNGGDGNGGNGSDVTPRFSDSFNSGDDSHSENGISWGNSTTAIVTDNPRTGTHSMRFQYPEGADGANRESRFNLPGLSEVWIEYYLWCPANFHHPAGTAGSNNKLLRIWGGDYGVGDPKAGASFRPMNGGTEAYGYFQWRNAEQGGLDDQDPASHWDLFTTDLFGTWIQLRWHFKLASGPDAEDAELELWQNGVQQIFTNEMTGPGGGREPWNWYGTGDDGNTLTEGYLMGWLNSDLEEQMEFYIDDIKFYDEDPGW